jgi:aspartyl-tRNA(Asn)/glutamyl-tRNA(Gln) amidotransferase subunit A
VNPVQRTLRSIEAIRATDEQIRAWVVVDEEGALRQADWVNAALKSGAAQPLAGVTVGVKDIFDAVGMPTIAGFLPFSRRPKVIRDAAVVAKLRAAGSIILGKTVTTQFAAGDPPMTRNPWDLTRTPGGSSSGSAAAVAARHVAAALGTQTGGSVLRPAAYCGVLGFKPTFGWASTKGLIPLAPALDHVGLFARSVTDLARLYDVLAHASLPRAGACTPLGAPRIGVWADPLARASAEMRDAVIDAVERLARAGATVLDATCPVSFQNLLAVHHTIMWSDMAAVHRRLIARYPDDYSPKLRMSVEVGAAVPADAYVTAGAARNQVVERLRQLWSDFDVVIIPTAEAGAPTPETTGNTELQAVITLLGLPAISVPIGFDPDGLPLAMQLIGPRRGVDVELLRVARWVETLMPTLPAPPIVADG